MAQDNKNFFARLNALFRSGPSIQRRVKGQDYKAAYEKPMWQRNNGFRTPNGYGKESSSFSTMGGFGIVDRMQRYSTFAEMEHTGEIAAALDIFADETCATNEKGKSFHVHSNNREIKKALEDLFYDTMNIEFSLRPWVRNCTKAGDFFLYNEVLPDVGVINCLPLPVNEVEREEGYDPNDPSAVRFKWITRGSRVLENWQVAHFRIMGNELYYPYGTSLLDPAIRIWRQVTMMEDSMLVYRVVRSGERRVFYIDVGNTAPNDIPSFMEAAKKALRSNTITEREEGRQDLRHNPVDVIDDYWIPTRGGESGTRIETLAGGQHVSATEDVEYLQKKLFSALKVPRAYLGYDESVGSKSTLAQEDIRFSRTINILQKIFIAEFNKIAMLHLYAKGFDGEDLVNFELFLSNPSSVALQQKLALWNDRADIAGKFKETGLVDEKWIHAEILGFTDDEINSIKAGRKEDILYQKELEKIAVSEDNQERVATTDPFDGSSYQVPGAEVERETDDVSPGISDKELVSGISKFDTEGNVLSLEVAPGKGPIAATPYATNRRRNDKRRVGQGGDFNLATPNFAKMLDQGGRNKETKTDFENLRLQTNEDVVSFSARQKQIEDIEKELEMKRVLRTPTKPPYEVQKMFENFDKKFKINRNINKMILEGFDEKLEKGMQKFAEQQKDNKDKTKPVVLKEAPQTENTEDTLDSAIESLQENITPASKVFNIDEALDNLDLDFDISLKTK